MSDIEHQLRRPRYYVACSFDGFIADEHGSVDWLSPFFSKDYGFTAFMETVDTAIAGQKTFKHTLALTGGKRTGIRTVVLTTRAFDSLPPDTSIPAEFRFSTNEAYIERDPQTGVIKLSEKVATPHPPTHPKKSCSTSTQSRTRRNPVTATLCGASNKIPSPRNRRSCRGLSSIK